MSHSSAMLVDQLMPEWRARRHELNTAPLAGEDWLSTERGTAAPS